MAYTYENLARVKDSIAKRRVKALEEAEQNRRHLHAISPEAVEIDAALAQTAMRLFGVACMENTPEKTQKMDEIRAENLSLQEARTSLLTHLGLPKNYTEPQYICTLCGDTGYVGVNMCQCMKQALAIEGFRTSGVGYLIDKQTFDNFRLDYYRGKDLEIMRRNLTIAKNYADNFTLASPNLMMMGATGLGKTHLSTAIAREVILRGYSVRYDSAQNIIGAYEHDRFHSGRGEEKKEAQPYETCDLLILDDLGTEFQSTFSISTLYYLINLRLNCGRPTIVSTNFTAGDLRSHYDDRIASRLMGHYQPLMFRGDDVRFQKLTEQ